MCSGFTRTLSHGTEDGWLLSSAGYCDQSSTKLNFPDPSRQLTFPPSPDSRPHPPLPLLFPKIRPGVAGVSDLGISGKWKQTKTCGPYPGGLISTHPRLDPLNGDPGRSPGCRGRRGVRQTLRAELAAELRVAAPGAQELPLGSVCWFQGLGCCRPPCKKLTTFWWFSGKPLISQKVEV